MNQQFVDQPFGRVAPNYDATFSSHPLGRWLRASVSHYLDRSFAEGDVVLELGCGTGKLADKLLRAHLPPHASYIGVDISPAMLARDQTLTRQKAWSKLRIEMMNSKLPEGIDTWEDAANALLGLFGKRFRSIDLGTEEGKQKIKDLNPGSGGAVVVAEQGGPFIFANAMEQLIRANSTNVFWT